MTSADFIGTLLLGEVVQVQVVETECETTITLGYKNGRQLTLQSFSCGYGGETAIEVKEVV